MWEIEGTDEFAEWYWSLERSDQEKIDAAVDTLAQHGPKLRRPLVGEIQQSRHKNMKELIPPASTIRVFFIFDPRRTAILLIGGDKEGHWTEFYDDMVPEADGLFDEHLVTIKREGG